MLVFLPNMERKKKKKKEREVISPQYSTSVWEVSDIFKSESIQLQLSQTSWKVLHLVIFKHILLFFIFFNSLEILQISNFSCHLTCKWHKTIIVIY